MIECKHCSNTKFEFQGLIEHVYKNDIENIKDLPIEAYNKNTSDDEFSVLICSKCGNEKYVNIEANITIKITGINKE